MTKYLDCPIGVSITEEGLRLEDTPWFTVSFNPSTNIKVAAEFFCGDPPTYEHPFDDHPASSQGRFHCHEDLLEDFSLFKIGTLAVLNITFPEFVEKLGQPHYKRNFFCTRKNDMGSTCGMPPPPRPPPPPPPPLRPRSKRSISDELRPVVKITQDGKWETRLYWDRDYTALKLCSTFKPNLVMEAGAKNKYTMTSHLDKSNDFNMSNQA